MQKARKIFVLGSLNMDLVIQAPYMPNAGETVIGGGFMKNPGGKGANQAVACGKQGAGVFLIGSVGEDSFGIELLENLAKYNVQTEFISKVADCPSGIAVIMVAENENRIILDSGANFKIRAAVVEQILRKKAHKNDIFITQLEVPLNIVHAGLKIAKSLGMYTILNPAPATKLDDEVYQYIDLLIPNQIEACTISGCNLSTESGLALAGSFFSCKGVKDTVVTLGDRGAVILKGSCIEHVRPYEADAVDPTAAGDTFIGSLAVALSEGTDLSTAVKRAGAAAAITVTRRGAQQAIPWKKEIDDFFKVHNVGGMMRP